MSQSTTYSLSRHRLVVLGIACAFIMTTAAMSAAETASTGDKAPLTPIISTDAAVEAELLNLDRLLDTNPKLEEMLRNNLDQLTQETFRAKNPEIDELLKKRPALVRALRTERHYFVHRSVARLAQARVTRKDAIALDQFLTAHPDIAKALQKRPAQIVNGDFLVAHPRLAEFFEKHPALSSVLLKRAEKKQATKTAPAKK